jgi:hypothetical protein
MNQFRNENRMWNGWGRADFQLYDENIKKELKNFLDTYLEKPQYKQKEVQKQEILQKNS